MARILDACCGSRMFWYDRENKHTIYQDNRELNTTLCDGRKKTRWVVFCKGARAGDNV
mgnify:CR=1 FL=1